LTNNRDIVTHCLSITYIWHALTHTHTHTHTLSLSLSLSYTRVKML